MSRVTARTRAGPPTLFTAKWLIARGASDAPAPTEPLTLAELYSISGSYSDWASRASRLINRPDFGYLRG